jgi:hypothetical protein
VTFVLAVDDGLDQPPHGVAGEAHRQGDQRRRSPVLSGELAQGALPVGGLPALTQRDLDGQDADQGVTDTFGDQADPAGPLDPVTVADRPAGRADPLCRR